MPTTVRILDIAEKQSVEGTYGGYAIRPIEVASWDETAGRKYILPDGLHNESVYAEKSVELAALSTESFEAGPPAVTANGADPFSKVIGYMHNGVRKYLRA